MKNCDSVVSLISDVVDNLVQRTRAVIDDTNESDLVVTDYLTQEPCSVSTVLLRKEDNTPFEKGSTIKPQPFCDLREFGTTDGSGGDVSAAINQRIIDEVGSLSTGQNEFCKVFFLGDLFYVLEAPILIQQKHVSLLGHGAKLMCNNVAEHGIELNHENLSPNLEDNEVQGLKIYDAVSHGLHAHVSHYLRLNRVEAERCGGDGIRLEGTVTATVDECVGNANAGVGFKELPYVKNFIGDGGNPPTALPRATQINHFRAQYNGEGGIACWDSQGTTINDPHIEVNGGAPSVNTGVGIALENTIGCGISSGYFETHLKDIVVNRQTHGFGPATANGQNWIKGSIFAGNLVQGALNTSVEIDAARTTIGCLRAVNIDILPGANETIIEPGVYVSSAGSINDQGTNTHDLRP